MSYEENIKNLNIELPKAADPVGSYIAAKIVNKLLYISGQISISENKVVQNIRAFGLENFFQVPAVKNRVMKLGLGYS